MCMNYIKGVVAKLGYMYIKVSYCFFCKIVYYKSWANPRSNNTTNLL